MQAFRGVLSWWNEAGLVISGLLCLGYFGSRGMLGFWPQIAAIAFIFVGIALCVMLATKAVSADEFGMQKGLGKVDSGVIYIAIFLLTTALVVTIGAIL